MPGDAIHNWFVEWERLIRDIDYAGARKLFDDDVVGFGTYMRLVHGIDELVDAQWRSIWGRITDFRFDLDSLTSRTSADGLSGWGLCLWTSTGYDADHRPFARPGRATVLLTRSAVDAPWLGVHTHLSLVPGTPQQTFGALVHP
ncbi:nuclear transport factor 2 family protein [Mycolicibacterium sp.]|uniref:nuclear transport factor 2 family protein n=1 Tax=Mycolicibacterium sp. TaxID=2320850 RepID=UPI0025E536FF|nr:nuclear transport factor 2 family protein [Mycolicibacterium sp.]